MDIAAYWIAGASVIPFALFGVFYAQHKIASIVLFGVGVICLTVAACLFWIKAVSPSPAPETQTNGFLVPANDPTPPNSCRNQPPADAMMFYFGNSVFWETREDAYTLIATLNPLEQLLSVRKTPDGLLFSAVIRSKDNRIVAEVIDNEFHINPNNYYRRERPDPHTLRVFDQEGNAVLHVRYLNPNAIKVLGTFYSGNRPPVVITEDEQQISGMRMSRGCGKFPAGGIAIMIAH